MILNFVISVLDREREKSMLNIYGDLGLPLILTMLGRGTAKSEHLELNGLEATEKAIVVTVADAEKTKQLIKNAKRKLFIDIPGNGVIMAVPVKSVGGGNTLAYLTDNTTPDKAVPEMQFEHEMIVAILNHSYMDDVMTAARSAGAAGGTVLHAKGTAAKDAQKFFGVSLANEKEVILIAARSDEKAAIMRAITTMAGPQTPAGTICFSLPVSTVAGLRNTEKD